jgi:hypothetical protein
LSTYEKQEKIFGDKKWLRIEITKDNNTNNKQKYALLGGDDLKICKYSLPESSG